MPARCTASGSIAPLSTSLSHSTSVSLAAVAITGLKFFAVRQNRRLPKRSAICARTSEDVAAAVDLANFLALLDDRADAGRRVERRDPRPCGTHPLGERALRRD